MWSSHACDALIELKEVTFKVPEMEAEDKDAPTDSRKDDFE